MQYKIPVQIENEDTIFLWLSWKQLTIVAVWGMGWFKLFEQLSMSIPASIAAIPAILICLICLAVALFKKDWMTFTMLILSLVRMNINIKERFWIMWVDSFCPLDIWYVTLDNKKEDNKIEVWNKMEKIKNLEDSLNKL